MDNIRERAAAAICSEMTDCTGAEYERLSMERTKLKQAYLGYNYTEDEDRATNLKSVYVDRTVFEVVEWAKPALLRVFTSANDVVTFEESTGQDRQSAEEATKYINEMLFGKKAFNMLYNVINDCLLQRTGWVKVWYDEQDTIQYKRRAGLSGLEAQVLLAVTPDPNSVDLIKTGQDTYDVILRTAKTDNRVRIESISPEQVIYNLGAKSVEDARFIAHWEYKTIAELLEAGYDGEVLESADWPCDYPETQVNNAIANDGRDATDADRTNHGNMRMLRLYEAYIILQDDIGASVRYKATFVGDKSNVGILDLVPWEMDRPPLFPVSSIPVPHTLNGYCLADAALSLQDLRTDIIRQGLDALALGNFNEMHVNTGNMGKIDETQLLERGPGKVIMSSGDVSLTPLPVDSDIAERAFNALTYTDQMKETRTGIGQQIQGMSSDAMLGSATGASIVYELANQRLDMVARIITESWAKPVCKYILKLCIEYSATLPSIYKTSPAMWNPDMDVYANVGLGVNDNRQQVANLQQLLTVQQAMLEKLGPLSPVRLENIVNTCYDLTKAMNISNPERYFGPSELTKMLDEQIKQQAANKEPSPEQQLVELEKNKVMGQLALADKKLDNDIKLEQTKTLLAIEEMEAKAALEMNKQQGQVDTAIAKEWIDAGSQRTTSYRS